MPGRALIERVCINPLTLSLSKGEFGAEPVRLGCQEVGVAFHVYMLRCADGSYYVGHTDNLEQRMGAHQSGEIPGYMRGRRPVELVWSEPFESRDDAFQRERQIKGWSRRKKEAVIRGAWEELPALSRSRASTPSRQVGSAHPDPVGSAHPELVEG